MSLLYMRYHWCACRLETWPIRYEDRYWPHPIGDIIGIHMLCPTQCRLYSRHWLLTRSVTLKLEKTSVLVSTTRSSQNVFIFLNNLLPSKQRRSLKVFGLLKWSENSSLDSLHYSSEGEDPWVFIFLCGEAVWLPRELIQHWHAAKTVYFSS